MNVRISNADLKTKRVQTRRRRQIYSLPEETSHGLSVSVMMLYPATGMHHPASPRPPCSVDVRRAAAGDKVARQRLYQEKCRAKKRLSDIALFECEFDVFVCILSIKLTIFFHSFCAVNRSRARIWSSFVWTLNNLSYSQGPFSCFLTFFANVNQSKSPFQTMILNGILSRSHLQPVQRSRWFSTRSNQSLVLLCHWMLCSWCLIRRSSTRISSGSNSTPRCVANLANFVCGVTAWWWTQLYARILWFRLWLLSLILSTSLFLPKFGWKVMCGLRSLIRDCKDIGMFLFGVLGIIVFVFVLVFTQRTSWISGISCPTFSCPPRKLVWSSFSLSCKHFFVVFLITIDTKKNLVFVYRCLLSARLKNLPPSMCPLIFLLPPSVLFMDWSLHLLPSVLLLPPSSSHLPCCSRSLSLLSLRTTWLRSLTTWLAPSPRTKIIR